MKYIWIYGPSAIGKATFIDYLKDDDEKRSLILGCCSDESIEYISETYDNLDLLNKKLEVLNANYILIKYQNVYDSGFEEFIKCSIGRGVEQKFILPWINPKEHLKRFTEKYPDEKKQQNEDFLRGSLKEKYKKTKNLIKRINKIELEVRDFSDNCYRKLSSEEVRTSLE